LFGRSRVSGECVEVLHETNEGLVVGVLDDLSSNSFRCVIALCSRDTTVVDLFRLVNKCLRRAGDARARRLRLQPRKTSKLPSHLVEDSLTPAGSIEHLGYEAMERDMKLDLAIFEVLWRIDVSPTLRKSIAGDFALSPTWKEDYVFETGASRHVFDARE